MYFTVKNLSRITIFFSVTNEFHYPVRDKNQYMATLTRACRRIVNVLHIAL